MIARFALFCFCFVQQLVGCTFKAIAVAGCHSKYVAMKDGQASLGDALIFRFWAYGFLLGSIPRLPRRIVVDGAYPVPIMLWNPVTIRHGALRRTCGRRFYYLSLFDDFFLLGIGAGNPTSVPGVGGVGRSGTRRRCQSLAEFDR